MRRGRFWGWVQVNSLLVLVGACKNGAQKALFKTSSLLHPEDRKYSSTEKQGGVCVFNPRFLVCLLHSGLSPQGSS